MAESTINSLVFKTKFATELDKILAQASQAAVLEDKKFGTNFIGARTVKVPKIGFVGLGDYSKDSGFSKGGVTVSHATYTLEQDRSRSFSIDREDMNEMGIATLAGQVMSEFVRTKVAPEVDAYTFSKIATAAATASNTVTLGSGETLGAKAFSLVQKAINKVNESLGFSGEDILLYVNPEVYAALMATPEISRHIRTDEFKNGEMTCKVRKIDNAIILPVASDRMKTKYTFDAGATTTAGGFTAVGDKLLAETTNTIHNVGILAMPKNAAMLVKKTEKIRTFAPDNNQDKDAYRFDYRLYYDLFIKDSVKDAIYTYIYANA